MALQLSAVHEFPSTQSRGVPGTHPVNPLQVSSPSHTLLLSHTSGTPFVHPPFWHVPLVVQRSPHGVPFGTNALPGHGTPPPAHVSATSHTLTGARHSVPPGSGGCVQVP